MRFDNGRAFESIIRYYCQVTSYQTANFAGAVQLDDHSGKGVAIDGKTLTLAWELCLVKGADS